MTSTVSNPGSRIGVLDGWRAVSILLVMAAHMLPLGWPEWRLNSAAGPAGMSIFFTLSGFLITSGLLDRAAAVPFLVRRVTRIVPLAFLASTLVLLAQGASLHDHLSLWFFFWNYDPTPDGIERVSHFWSLCVEMQFYAAIACIVGTLGRRGLVLLPFLGLLVTAMRVGQQQPINIMTHLRLDEILAGCTLALAVRGEFGIGGERMLAFLRRVPLPLLLVAFLVSCHQASGPAQYARPWLGSSLVGVTLVRPTFLTPWLSTRPLRYVAEISYALYVIHPLTMFGWMGTGDLAVRYAKRAVSILLTFALAHVSTYAFERRFTELGRRLARRLESREAPSAARVA
ncbi:MAG: acyltransferase [Phycisphaerae bacterium]|jgi:peptidoglycan/LPS O-acetylase OafA/YrhL